ncbi:hypothetical protein BKA70DRAFT_1236403 [Coprinopsis sp. MPI-PUGE-AT-0042]|nr:hypothetical protein BKA70DRAFT_1236403 [Coprinopsis sp. MPI-PUGE-AT-0042]
MTSEDVGYDCDASPMQVDDDHPLVAQLNGLKAALNRMQDELQRSSAQVQGGYLKASDEHDKLSRLQDENRLLREELAVLRTIPHPDSIPRPTQVQELTLSLRKLSDKLDLTEELLFSRNHDLNRAKGEVVRAKIAEEKAYELAARIRGREEALKQREKELEHQVKAAEEKANMADLAVSEYANLVRAMDAKSAGGTSNGSAHLEKSFAEGKAGLTRLMLETHEETAKLERKLDQIQADYAALEARFQAQVKATALEQESRSQIQLELDRLRVDDNTAAKMVSRYMKFSQAQTDSLQDAMTALKTRHGATVDNLTSQVYNLNRRLEASQTSLERFKSALDDLVFWATKRGLPSDSNDIERRRMSEELRRWVRRANEAIERLSENTASYDLLNAMVQDAATILSSLDLPPQGRTLLTHHLVEEMKEDLKFEKSRQIQLRRIVAELGGEVPSELGITDGWSPPIGWMEVKEGDIRVENERSEISTKAHSHDSPSDTSITSESLDLNRGRIPAIVVHANTCDEEDEQAATPTLRTTTLPSDNDMESVTPKSSPAGVDESSTTPHDFIPALDDIAAATLPTTDIGDPKPSFTSSENRGEGPGASVSSQPVVPATLTDRIPSVHDGLVGSIPNERNVECPPQDTTSQLSARNLPEVPPLDKVPMPIVDPAARAISPIGGSDSDRQEPLELVATMKGDATPIPVAHQLPVPDLPSPSPVSLSPLPISTTTQLPLSTPRPEPPPLPTSPPPSLSVPQSPIPKPVPLPHHLLEPLQRVKGRYEDIQRGFRDCHTSLESLKTLLASPRLENDSVGPIPFEILRVALDRLNDFVEDARVELEIQTSDEELLAKGYETLLAIPGAMGAVSPSPLVGGSYSSLSSSAASLAASSSSGDGKCHAAVSSLAESTSLSAAAISETERQIEAFVYGTDANVRKARATFDRKLEDAQHDIAALKRAIHDPDSLTVTSDSSPPSSHDALGILTPTSASTTPNSRLLSPLPTHGAPNLLLESESVEATTPASSTTPSSWSSWIRRGSSPAPPTTPATAPASFGNIMTSPRLRHSPSLQGGLRTKSLAPSSHSQPSDGDVLQGLGLRIPMPKFTLEMANRMQKQGSEKRGSLGPGGVGQGVGGVVSPLGATMQKARTTSAMYMLGLGGRAVSGPVGTSSTTRIGQDQPASLLSTSTAARSFSTPSAAFMGQWSRSGSSATPPTSQQRLRREERHKARMAERDIDGETDVEIETEGEETETEDSGSDTDLE